MPERPVPTATYRLQLHAQFGFDDAREQVPYLTTLGISHLYLSPVLQAAPGSQHGYDVVDHTRVSLELGGEAALLALAETAHVHGLGIVVDVVPNHMALPTPAYLNAPLWETLRIGRASQTAAWFDIDWDLCAGRIGLPLLGAPLDEVLAAGELSLDEHAGEPVIAYYDQRLPVAPNTLGGSVADVLARQHYLLASWREKDDVLGYRRFFDVDTLVAVRVELPEVFDATHAVLIDLYERGVVDGFRIDHPDGLADPQGYLARLREATDGAWVVVEKILVGDESLPAGWDTAGTTGYDAIRAVQTALVPDTGSALDELWRSTGGEPSLAQTELAAKRLALDILLAPELHRLVRRATTAATDAGHELSPGDAEDGLRELLVRVQTYRAYLRLDEPPDTDAVDRLTSLHASALKARPDLAGPLGVLLELLLDSSTSSEAGRDLAVRFQQVCGPVMAKGVEDTAFYRFNRMIALNEVGGDPGALDAAPGADALHAWADRQSLMSPTGMTALSTHDTKRGEDVRAGLLAAAGDLTGWRDAWSRVRAAATALGVDEPTAYLVMQTLVGAWPIDLDRLAAYLGKAVREAKQHTAWTDGDEDYERRVHDLAARCLAEGDISSEVASWAESLQPGIRAIVLSSKLLQLMLPGVPDVYQGSETVVRSLVDPDNRRPVDYDDRRQRLEHLDAGGGRRDLDDEKLWVTSRALRLRRDRPELIGAKATYRALPTTTRYVVGFVRSEQIAVVATRWSPRQASGWAAESVSLPDGSWSDVLSESRGGLGGTVSCADLFADLPVALLIRQAE
jgi:(1->4)-alpha-D-glucan 1-alpha-D-glucosylmutase